MSTEQQHLESRPALAGGAGDDLELDREEWAAVCPREITPEQWSRFEGYMEEIFTAMGMPAGTALHRRHPAPLPAGDLRRDQRVRGR